MLKRSPEQFYPAEEGGIFFLNGFGKRDLCVLSTGIACKRRERGRE
jgi:hypothetical protein